MAPPQWRNHQPQPQMLALNQRVSSRLHSKGLNYPVSTITRNEIPRCRNGLIDPVPSILESSSFSKQTESSPQPGKTDDEMTQTSGDSNFTITPLFSKTITNIHSCKRFVVPTKCAETYLPEISDKKWIPLEVEDISGKKWIFQFHFWTQYMQRTYALEGVERCIQSMQLKAGDTVTLSMIDPEKKLIVGFEKANSASVEQCVPAPKGDDQGIISPRKPTDDRTSQLTIKRPKMDLNFEPELDDELSPR